MRRWHGLAEVPADWGRSVVTIGVFDGVHRGHQRIVGRAVELGRELGLPTVVITFDPHPDEVIRPGTHPLLLSTPRRRAELLASLGVDAVCVLPFTYALSQVGPDEFVRTVLVDRLHTAGVIVGADFVYGHRAAGDVALLRQLGEKYDFVAEGVPLVANGVTVTSTRIRELVATGDVIAAAKALGRPHRVEGVVVRGHQRGRELGFPTANFQTPPYTAIPRDGVYAGWLLGVAGPGREEVTGEVAKGWPAAISIGSNPTFDGSERTVEAYALDRTDLDLYGEQMAVDFHQLLRDTLRFDSIEALIEQMQQDVDETREIMANAAY